MKKDKDYLSTILIIAAAGFSLFIILQNFLSQTNQRGISAGLPLIIPALALLIPLVIVLIIMILREVKYKKNLANGVKSVGFITKITETRNDSKKKPEVKLELNVLEENGNEFFGEVTTVVHYAELEFLKEGEPVPIIYKLNNKQEISIDRKPDVNQLKDKIDRYKKQNNVK
jgi:hypothetical protein